jgi:hypothetical protein
MLRAAGHGRSVAPVRDESALTPKE